MKEYVVPGVSSTFLILSSLHYSLFITSLSLTIRLFYYPLFSPNCFSITHDQSLLLHTVFTSTFLSRSLSLSSAADCFLHPQRCAPLFPRTLFTHDFFTILHQSSLSRSLLRISSVVCHPLLLHIVYLVLFLSNCLKLSSPRHTSPSLSADIFLPSLLIICLSTIHCLSISHSFYFYINSGTVIDIRILFLKLNVHSNF